MLLDLVFPKQCLNCSNWGSYVCNSCCLLLRPNILQRCIICQKPSSLGYTHPKCKTRFSPDRLITIFKYSDELVAKIINTAKLRLVSDLFCELTEKSLEFVQTKNNNLHKFTICSIPSHTSKTLHRGFNHSVIISKTIAAGLNLPIDNFLHKVRYTKQQKSLNKISRQTNLDNSFSIKINESLPNFVLLIDDITTTGSTLIEATKVIKQAGINTVWCLALAQD